MPKYLKIFGKAQVDISLGLGTLIENNVYPELEPEFQQFAYFTTTVGLQNTTQIQERVTLKPSKYFSQRVSLVDRAPVVEVVDPSSIPSRPNQTFKNWPSVLSSCRPSIACREAGYSISMSDNV